MKTQFLEVEDVLRTYLDGIYNSDSKLLSQVFHPHALYASVTEGELLKLNMDEYFPIVDKRQSPASRNEARSKDRILSIDFASPDTAVTRLECALGNRLYTDFITLIKVEGHWKIISKVFHYEIMK